MSRIFSHVASKMDLVTLNGTEMCVYVCVLGKYAHIGNISIYKCMCIIPPYAAHAKTPSLALVHPAQSAPSQKSNAERRTLRLAAGLRPYNISATYLRKLIGAFSARVSDFTFEK